MLTFEITPTASTMITYHVRALLGSYMTIHYFLLPDDRQFLTAVGADLMQRISTVPGVEDLVVSRYSFRITKAQAFTWAEIREAIESILTAD